MTAPVLAPTWLTVFLDFPQEEFVAGIAFWCAATGYRLSLARGDQREFATLLPPDGASYLRVQRLGAGATRLHLDVHVDDPVTAAEAAVVAGAEPIDTSRHGYLVLRSPAGVVFCLVGPLTGEPPTPRVWPDGHRSRVQQVCFDIPMAAYGEEVAFWRRLLGGSWTERASDPMITRSADGWAIELRLQPSLLASEPAGHLHVVSAERAAEVERLVSLGAIMRADRRTWTLMEAAGGLALCVLDDRRRPVSQ